MPNSLNAHGKALLSLSLRNLLSLPVAIVALIAWFLSSTAYYYRASNNPDLMEDPSRFVSWTDTLWSLAPDILPLLVAVAIAFALLDYASGTNARLSLTAWLATKIGRHRNADGVASSKEGGASSENQECGSASPTSSAARARDYVFQRAEHPVRTILPMAAMFALMLSCWTVWIFVHEPGTVRDDTIPQILQALGMHPWYDQHPVASSLVFGWFAQAGIDAGSLSYGLLAYILVQAVLTALAFTFALHACRRLGAPMWMLVAATLFYSLSRMIYQPIDAMSKDSLNALLFIASIAAFLNVRATVSMRSLLLGMKERFLGKAKAPSKPRIAFGIAVVAILVVLCALTKRTSGYILLALFAVMLAYDLVSGCRRRSAAPILSATGLLSTALSLLLLLPALSAIVGATTNKTYEMFSVPDQQMIYAAKQDPNGLSVEEAFALAEAFDIDKAMEQYNPGRSDEVHWNVDADGYSFAELLPVWLSIGSEHGEEYADAFWRLSGGWLDLRNQATFAHEFAADQMNEGRIEQWSSSFFGGDEEAATEFLRRFDPNGGDPEADERTGFEKTMDSLDNAQSAVPVASSMGCYAFLIPLVSLAYSVSRRRWEALALSSVSAILLASLLVGPIALYWYLIPCAYIAPVLLLLPALAFDMRCDSKRNERHAMTSATHMPPLPPAQNSHGIRAADDVSVDFPYQTPSPRYGECAPSETGNRLHDARRMRRSKSGMEDDERRSRKTARWVV